MKLSDLRNKINDFIEEEGDLPVYLANMSEHEELSVEWHYGTNGERAVIDVEWEDEDDDLA